MKRQTKIVLGASLVAAVFLLAPVLVTHLRSNREKDLLNRRPGAATAKFRNRIRGFTQVKVFFHIAEADTPGNQIPSTRKPDLILRGENAAQIERALHFEWRGGTSVWKYHSGSYAGSIFGCTALEFGTDDQTLADLRVGTERGGGLGARLYSPPTYVGDSCLLPESRDFLERKLNRRLTGF